MNIMNDGKKNSILIVDDEKLNIIALTDILSPEYEIFATKNGAETLHLAKKYFPDIILLDIIMPEPDGFHVLAMLKNDIETKNIPVIIISGLGGTEDEEKGLLLGAADYIVKPFSSTVVKLRVNNQISMINQLTTIKNLSMIDYLTNIPNRRNFESRLELEWYRAIRTHSHVSVMVIDIDDFKYYNDKYGHNQGDVALKKTAETMKDLLRRSIDFIARWGGEEFAVLLSDSSVVGAIEVAEHLRNGIEELQIPCDEGYNRITVSIGLNTVAPTAECLIKDFFANADKALYEAKKTGKNSVCVYEKDRVYN